MANITLGQFLQSAPRAIPIGNPGGDRRNTTCSKSAKEYWGWDDIGNVGVWQNFSWQTLMNLHGGPLAAVMLPAEPYPPYLLQSVEDEKQVEARICTETDDRTAHALEVTFNHLASTGPLANRGLTRVLYDVGSRPKMPGGVPDRFFHDGQHIRLPGDIKLSWKWSTALRHTDPKEFKQVLSQLNLYMKKNAAQYGFILTDQILVPVRRLDRNGNLELAPEIPWTRGGTIQAPVMTVLAGLWYLGMMAAEDANWSIP